MTDAVADLEVIYERTFAWVVALPVRSERSHHVRSRRSPRHRARSPGSAGLTAPRVPLEHLERAITELSGHLNAATARWLLLIGEYDRRRGWFQEGILSCAHWLMWKCSVSLQTAREHVRVAGALEGLPAITAAFVAGELSYSKVRAITRIATPANEDELLNMARYSTASQTDKFVRLYRGMLDDCDLDVEAAGATQRHNRRYLTHHFDLDGMLVIRARLAPEEGAVVLKALEAAQVSLSTDGRVELAEDLTAEADLTASAHADDSPAGEPGTGKDHCERYRPRKADALVAVAESALAHGIAARSGGDRYQVVVHVEAATLEGAEPLGRCELAGGPWLPSETVRRYACDASVVAITERDGEALGVGRKTRTITPALRRALAARDGGCCFPGCTNDRFTDGHHIVHWAAGGPTNLGNLTSLCRHHHGLVHEGGFGVHVGANGFTFTRPDGTVIPDTPLTPAPPGSDLRSINRARGLAVDPDTCLSLWDGEAMDYELSVWVLPRSTAS